MIAFGSLIYTASALLLIAAAIQGFARQQLSCIAFAALAGYSGLAAILATSLADQFNTERYVHGSLVYFVGSLSLALWWNLSSKLLGVRRLTMPTWTHDDFGRHANYALVLGVASFTLLSASRKDVMMTWSEARSESGIAIVLSTFCLLLACPGIVSSVSAKRPLTTITLFFLCGMSFILLGSRAAILGSLLCAIWLVLIRSRNTRQKLVIIAVAAIFGIAIHVLLRQIRGIGIGGMLQAFQDGNLVSVFLGSDADADFSGGEAAIPKYFLFSTAVSSIYDFGFMSSMHRLAMLPIPRIESLIDKPIDVTYLLWEKAYVAGLFSEAQGQEILLDSYLTGSLGSLHATLFGEYFLTGGWISLMLSTAVAGWIFAYIDLAMRRMDRITSLALCGPILVGFLFVARGNSVIGLGYFFYLGIFFSLLRYLVSQLNCFSRLLRQRVSHTRQTSSNKYDAFQ